MDKGLWQHVIDITFVVRHQVFVIFINLKNAFLKLKLFIFLLLFQELNQFKILIFLTLFLFIIFYSLFVFFLSFFRLFLFPFDLLYPLLHPFYLHPMLLFTLNNLHEEHLFLLYFVGLMLKVLRYPSPFAPFDILYLMVPPLPPQILANSEHQSRFTVEHRDVNEDFVWQEEKVSNERNGGDCDVDPPTFF